MVNLFDVFSPVAIWGLPLNWLTMAFAVLILPGSLWAAPGSSVSGLRKLLRLAAGEFSAVLGATKGPGTVSVLTGLFLFVTLNNFLGLFPYVFTATSHVSVALALALPLWLGHTLMSWALQPNFTLAHLVPAGTPSALISFMVLIELLSSLIRPATLSVRLAANMIAGHLLLTLLSSQAPVAGVGSLILVMSGLSLLVVLEVAVAVIQGYVFSLLSTLYVQDVLTGTLSR